MQNTKHLRTDTTQLSKTLSTTGTPGFVFGMLLRLDSHNCIYKLNGQAGEDYMITNAYTANCDECADRLPLVAQLLTEARSEAANAGWTSERMDTGAQQWYCPTCSAARVARNVNPPFRPLTITE